MINFIRRHLGVRLFLSYLLVILVGALILGVATSITLRPAFNRHLLGMGNKMGMMQGLRPGITAIAELYRNFKASFNEALVFAFLAAGVVAILVSLLLSRGVIAPVRDLTSASRRIADGHYDERVAQSGEDELGQLANSFNRMAEKLEQTETMRRQLIGDVSHELRTPLTTIKGSMEGLIDGVLPATEETYRQIHQETERLANLVNDLQELSRVEARAYPLDLHPVDLAGIVQSTIKRISHQANAGNVELFAEIPSGLPLVMADEARLIQVVTNLLINAVQYTPPGGKVTLSAERIREEIVIQITDTGIGIAAQHIPHLFTRFYRVDKSRSRHAGGGSGVGLSIAKHLVEAQGGRIWAESEGEGKGSRFSFTIPVVVISKNEQTTN